MIGVLIPGKFMDHLSGSSLMQDIDVESLDWRCREAIKKGQIKQCGRGYRVWVMFPNANVAGVLADYADACLEANYGGEVDRAEVVAARKVLARLAKHGVVPV